MTAKKLKPQDLLESLKYVGERWSSADTVHTLSESPINVLVYNEIMRFSKKELESVKDIYGNVAIYNAVLATRNEFFYSALLEKKAFTNLLNKDSQWLLKQVKNPSLDLYDCIHNIETDRYKRRDKKYFISSVVNYLKKMDTPEKETVAKEFYDKYVKKHHQELVSHCFDRINEPLTDYFLTRFKEDKIDINQANLMQEFLPKKEYRDTSDIKFFISSILTNKIKSCLEKGFRFDEDNYDFNGKILMTALLKSERADLVIAILPYLKRVELISNEENSQAKIVDSHYEIINLYKNKKEFEQIKMIFCELVYRLYDQKLPEKAATESLKIKI